MPSLSPFILLRYNDLHLFELPGPTRVIEWIGDQRICVAGYENGSRNEILQLLLPPRLLARQNKGLCPERDFKVERGGICDRPIYRLKHVPGTSLLVTSGPTDSGIQVWCVVPDETDMIKLLSVISPTKTEDTSWSKIATSCAKPACVLHGQRISNLQMTEIESEKSLWVAGSASLDKIASLDFLDEATAVVCGAKGQLFLVDFRQQQGILGELEEVQTPWAQMEGLSWCAGVGSGEAPLIARLSLGGLVVLTDIRHPSSPLKMAQCCAPTSNLCGADFLSISLAPVLGDNLAVSGFDGTVQVYNTQDWDSSGQEAKPVFIHKGHIFSTPATWVGGAYINGTAEIVYLPSRGLVWVQAPVGFALSLLVGGFFFVNPMRMRNCVTLMDPIQEMYGNVMSCLLFIPPLIADIFWFAAVLASLGATMKVILDIQGYVAIILSACTVILYTLLGGLYSVAYTDVIQLIFISLSLWICIPFAIMNPATENIFHTATHNISQAPWTGKIEPEFYGRWFDDFLYLVLGAIPWQTYFQRVLAASSHKEARLISYFSGLGCFIMAIPSVLIGAVAASTDWNQTDYGLPTPYERNESALILPLVLQHLCPMYISVGGLGAIAAAVMSSGDSALLSAGSMFAHNIYRKIFRRKATEKEVLWAMRISMVAFGIISALLAFYSSSIYDLWFLSGELVYTLLFPQLCCALFLSSTNTYGSMVGFFLGFLLRLLAGEPSLKIPPVICYPGCSVVEGIFVQLFPFKMVTMLVTLVTIFSTSHLASFMFKSGILPAEWDVCQVTMDARMPVSFSRGERQMEEIQNGEQAEEAVMKDI
uniref:High-affinity choline transporter 1 n=1 Tax=Laticauda laticaudata TaxID=8630 RepID=A0A8C5SQY7_LATLA